MELRVYKFIFGFFILFISASCSNFGGVVGNSNRSYVSNYNYPALRMAPYDDPTIENKTPYRRKVKVCSGKTDSTGFKCQ